MQERVCKKLGPSGRRGRVWGDVVVPRGDGEVANGRRLAWPHAAGLPNALRRMRLGRAESARAGATTLPGIPAAQ